MAARVLVVDANGRRCEEECARLRQHQHEVIGVTAGNAALAASLELLPQVVLIHAVLPDMDTLDLARRFRLQHETASAVLVHITAPEAQESVAAFAAGIDLQLTSPDAAVDLARVIEAASIRSRLIGPERRHDSSRDADLDAMDLAYVPRPPVIGERQPGTILVVDDERAIRRLTESVLGRAGFTVVTKQSAAEALEWWRRHRDEVMLVLTDVVMPGGTGPEMLLAMRVDRPDLVAIVMSGYMGGANPNPSHKFEAFLHKPFTPDELRKAVTERIAQAVGIRG